MASCPCPDDTNTPDTPCCPDVIASADAIDVRDRNCKMGRLKAAIDGIVAGVNGKFKVADGSSDLPVNMNIEQVLASNGYVVVQSKSGRILAIKPDSDLVEANDILRLVFQDGVIKFVPESVDAFIMNDDEVTTTASAVLAALVCAGDGKVKVGKFLPGCITIEGAKRYLTIDGDGNVTCDDHDVGDCPEVTPVDELDSLWGCADGVFSPLLPIVGKKLVCGTGPKWTLEDDVPDTFYVAAGPFNIYTQQKTTTTPVSNVTNTDLTTIAGWDDSFTEVELDISLEGIVVSADYVVDIEVDGVRVMRMTIVAAYGSNNNDLRAWFPIKTSTPGNIKTELIFTLGTAGTFDRFNAYIAVVAFK